MQGIPYEGRQGLIVKLIQEISYKKTARLIDRMLTNLSESL